MTKEPQYGIFIDEFKENGAVILGPMSSYMARHDPKMMAIKLSRYKFIAKMLSGKNDVLEIGCGDSFGSTIVKDEVKNLTCTDFDPLWINYCKQINNNEIKFKLLNVIDDKIDEKYDAVFSMDVFEHILPKDEKKFIHGVINCLKDRDSVCIIGIPSLESQNYTSQINKEGHVNCKTGDDLKSLLLEYFNNVFIFSSNDEVVHTGYFKMAHYLIAVCCGVKRL
ncbi:MAG: class I SAM-dependent methyltransferase [Halarcobacter sp.]